MFCCCGHFWVSGLCPTLGLVLSHGEQLWFHVTAVRVQEEAVEKRLERTRTGRRQDIWMKTGKREDEWTRTGRREDEWTRTAVYSAIINNTWWKDQQ